MTGNPLEMKWNVVGDTARGGTHHLTQYRQN